MSVSPKRHIKISLDEFEKQPFLFFTHDDKNRESSNTDSNQDCYLCERTLHLNYTKYKFFMHQKINNFFSYKYASSENYYHSKDVNDIQSNTRCKSNYIFKEIKSFDKKEEFLRRFYNSEEYASRIEILTSYYQYHSEVPRMFMKGMCDVVHNFYDKKRKLNYKMVCKILGHGLGDMDNDSKSTIKDGNVHEMVDVKILPDELSLDSDLQDSKLLSENSNMILDRSSQNFVNEEESDTLRYLHKKLGDNIDINNTNLSYSWIQDPNFNANMPHDKTLIKIFDQSSETRKKTFLKKKKDLASSSLQIDKMSKLKQLLKNNNGTLSKPTLNSTKANTRIAIYSGKQNYLTSDVKISQEDDFIESLNDSPTFTSNNDSLKNEINFNTEEYIKKNTKIKFDEVELKFSSVDSINEIPLNNQNHDNDISRSRDFDHEKRQMIFNKQAKINFIESRIKTTCENMLTANESTKKKNLLAENFGPKLIKTGIIKNNKSSLKSSQNNADFLKKYCPKTNIQEIQLENALDSNHDIEKVKMRESSATHHYKHSSLKDPDSHKLKGKNLFNKDKISLTKIRTVDENFCRDVDSEPLINNKNKNKYVGSSSINFNFRIGNRDEVGELINVNNADGEPYKKANVVSNHPTKAQKNIDNTHISPKKVNSKFVNQIINGKFDFQNRKKSLDLINKNSAQNKPQLNDYYVNKNLSQGISPQKKLDKASLERKKLSVLPKKDKNIHNLNINNINININFVDENGNGVSKNDPNAQNLSTKPNNLASNMNVESNGVVIDEVKKSAKDTASSNLKKGILMGETQLTAKSFKKESNTGQNNHRISPTIYVKEKKAIFGSRKSEARERGLQKLFSKKNSENYCSMNTTNNKELLANFYNSKPQNEKSKKSKIKNTGVSTEEVYGNNLRIDSQIDSVNLIENKYTKKGKRSKGSQNPKHNTLQTNTVNNSLSINNFQKDSSLIDNFRKNIVNTNNYYDIFGMRRSVNEGVLFRALEKQKEYNSRNKIKEKKRKNEGGKLIKNKTTLTNQSKKSEDHKKTFESVQLDNYEKSILTNSQALNKINHAYINMQTPTTNVNNANFVNFIEANDPSLTHITNKANNKHSQESDDCFFNKTDNKLMSTENVEHKFFSKPKKSTYSAYATNVQKKSGGTKTGKGLDKMGYLLGSLNANSNNMNMSKEKESNNDFNFVNNNKRLNSKVTNPSQVASNNLNIKLDYNSKKVFNSITNNNTVNNNTNITHKLQPNFTNNNSTKARKGSVKQKREKYVMNNNQKDIRLFMSQDLNSENIGLFSKSQTQHNNNSSIGNAEKYQVEDRFLYRRKSVYEAGNQISKDCNVTQSGNSSKLASNIHVQKINLKQNINNNRNNSNKLSETAKIAKVYDGKIVYAASNTNNYSKSTRKPKSFVTSKNQKIMSSQQNQMMLTNKDVYHNYEPQVNESSNQEKLQAIFCRTNEEVSPKHLKDSYNPLEMEVSGKDSNLYENFDTYNDEPDHIELEHELNFSQINPVKSIILGNTLNFNERNKSKPEATPLSKNQIQSQNNSTSKGVNNNHKRDKKDTLFKLG